MVKFRRGDVTADVERPAAAGRTYRLSAYRHISGHGYQLYLSKLSRRGDFCFRIKAAAIRF